MIACHVAEVHDWETTYKLGKFMLVVLIGYVCVEDTDDYYDVISPKQTLSSILFQAPDPRRDRAAARLLPVCEAQPL